MTTLSGWAFTMPAFDDSTSRNTGFSILPTGQPRMLSDLAVTRQSILLLLSTYPGERVMRPAYGCRLHELAFAANDDTTAGLAMHHVRRAVERWIPHAEVVAVDAFADADDAAILHVQLDYRHRPTAMADRLDFSVALTGSDV